MAGTNDLHLFAKDMSKIAQAISGQMLEGVMTDVGMAGKDAANQAARIPPGGDARFSGWPKPGPLEARFTLHKDGAGVTVHRAPRSAGPWRVAEDGRNGGGHSGFAGPGVNRKTGETSRTKSGGLRKVRVSGGRRWNGRTPAKGSWTAAENAAAAKAPAAFEKSAVAAIQKAWGG